MYEYHLLLFSHKFTHFLASPLKVSITCAIGKTTICFLGSPDLLEGGEWNDGSFPEVIFKPTAS